MKLFQSLFTRKTKPMAVTTQIEKIKQQAQSLKQQICQLLSWDELSFAEYQYETGIKYLRYYIPTDKWGQAMLIRDKIFWNWWKNQWVKRDEEFIDDNFSGEYNAMRACYKSYHDAEALAREITPSGIVLGVSYKKMIQELFDTA